MKRIMCLLGAALLLFVTASAQAQERAALGVSLSDQPADNAAGALVTSVSAGSPAAQAGLMPGDRIVALNRETVSSCNDVLRIVGANVPGSQVSVDVMRGTTRISMSTTLGAASQVFPGELVSARTSTLGYQPLQCNASGGGCVRYYYRPHHHWSCNRSSSCGGGYRHWHHGCHSGCR
jgi:membrane-associated protease RseP (regulator of RpoE activity)